jgi:hypothetical protein
MFELVFQKSLALLLGVFLMRPLDEKIELIEKELEVVKEFKKGLLQQMFV